MGTRLQSSGRYRSSEASHFASPRFSYGRMRSRLTRPVQSVQASFEKADNKRYNEEMAEKMKWGDNPYAYDFERGLYYHRIHKDVLLCGSQPTSVGDIDYLRDAENIDVVVSLQQIQDVQYWNINGQQLQERCKTRNVTFVRRPVQDFDPKSLRRTLPSAVQTISSHLDTGKRVYVHCTAGLGRAPATCIAYLFWFHDFTLDSAYDHVTSIRPCGPNRDAIRGATYDILSGGDADAFAALPHHAYSTLEQEDRYALQYRILKS